MLARYLLHILAAADQGAAPCFGYYHLIAADVAPILLSYLLYCHVSTDSLLGMHMICGGTPQSDNCLIPPDGAQPPGQM